MTAFDTLIERNKEFAAHGAPKDLPLLPALGAIVIGCVDPRIDPAHLLGLELGDAVVIRNIGGRVTPSVLQTLQMLNRIGGGRPAGEMHLIVLQHTQCGITRLAGETAMLANYFGVDEEGLKSKAVTDPRAAVAVDVAILKASLPPTAGWRISGLVYDVHTGLVDIVVPPSTNPT